MKFRLISDIHNEFFGPNSQYELPTMTDEKDMVLVIAGDFTMLKKAASAAPAITNMLERFKAVIYVPGNHEYYSSRIEKPKNLSQFAEMNPKGYKNFYPLIREKVEIDGVVFIGASLWTDLNKGCPVTELEVKGYMSDFRLITYYNEFRKSYGNFKPKDWLTEHMRDLAYFNEEIRAAKDKRVVVVSHHAPSMQSQDLDYVESYYSTFGYLSNLDDFIHSNPNIKYWCHGHIHKKMDYFIGETNVVCNPHGYIHSGEVTGFYDKEVFSV